MVLIVGYGFNTVMTYCIAIIFIVGFFYNVLTLLDRMLVYGRQIASKSTRTCIIVNIFLVCKHICGAIIRMKADGPVGLLYGAAG